MRANLIAALLIVSLSNLLAGCATGSRSEERPNGQVRTYYDTDRTPSSYRIVSAEETDSYVLLGVAGVGTASEKVQEGFDYYSSWGAKDPGLCFGLGVLTCGFYWVVDGLLWITGGYDRGSMCFSSLAIKRNESWHSPRLTGKTVEMLVQPGYPSFDIVSNGRRYGTVSPVAGVVQIWKHNIPETIEKEKIVIVQSGSKASIVLSNPSR